MQLFGEGIEMIRSEILKEIAPILGKSQSLADDFLKGLKDGADKLFE